jgi:hypothetical protein
MKKTTFNNELCVRCFSKDENMSADQLCTSCVDDLKQDRKDATDLVASLPVDDDIEDLKASIPDNETVSLETCKTPGCEEMPVGEGYCDDCGEAENEARFEAYLDFLHSQ